MSYTDALFFTGGASTQAGLNTVNVNDLALYQQICFYILTTLTTPIFIHGSLLFVRLYYFERHFDNIKEKSILDFKMRREATLSRQRTDQSRRSSRSSLRRNTEVNQGIGLDMLEKEIGDSSPGSKEGQSSSDSSDLKQHEPEPEQNNDSGIKFGNLPHPPKRRKSFDPEEMYRSINLLKQQQEEEKKEQEQEEQKQKQKLEEQRSAASSIRFATEPNRRRSTGHSLSQEDDSDDEVLIIKPPNEIESSIDHQDIFTTKKMKAAVTGPIRKQWRKRKHYSPWTAKLKKTISGGHRRSLSGNASPEEEEIEDDDASIDSENFRSDGNPTEDEGNDEEEDDDNDDDNDDDDDDDEEDSETENEGSEHEDATDLTKATSNLVLPSHDASGGIKFTKRRNTIEGGEKPSHSPKRKSRPKIPRTRTPRPDFHSRRTQILHGRRPSSDEESSFQETGSRLSRTMSTNYLSWTPTVGRNSTFVYLTDEQKDELGGVEYRAVKLLIKILVSYYIGFHLICALILLIWVYCMPNHKQRLLDLAITPAWWAFFTAQSAFNDLGFTLTNDSMISFNESAIVLIVCSFFIVIGNTGFPVFLRFIIWLLFKTAKPMSLYKESLGFLLDHPRRCFTLLFPSGPTWWLFAILVILNGFDLIIFCIVDLKDSSLASVPVGYRVLGGLFQAFCTRTVGFTVMDLSQLHAAVQVSYMVMMYISVLPLAISIRRTNVYEEQSLGVYAKGENHDNENENDPDTPSNYVGAHLRNQLSYDIWYIFLGLFIICLAEGGRLRQQDFRFSVFSILFEIISAYGTVGMSLGYPNVDTSLSGQFTVISKLVIVAMMIRGRHRGLPYTIDRAIMLPDAEMKRHDRMQETHALQRNNTLEAHPSNALRRVATIGGSGGPIDAGENILSRVYTNVQDYRRRKHERKIKSRNPNYIVTTVSNI
ncbi:Low-affinity potassium transport protein [Spathaspora sp. JA1]|nr:Low-affinity potassium transport protein [Spathaspora sp. JA1]